MLINTDMRVAIIIAGEPRFCNYVDSFINSLQGVDQADWFFYLWDETIIKSTHKQITTGWNNILNREWAINNIHDKLPNNHKIVDLQLGQQSQVPEQLPLYKQFFSLQQADLLRQEYEKTNSRYDLVIRARLDLLINSPIDLQSIKLQLDQNPKLMFLPVGPRYGYGVKINDQFAISSSGNMSIYTNLINYIKDYQNKGIAVHPETQLSHHLLHNGLELKHDINIGILNQGDPANFGRWIVS